MEQPLPTEPAGLRFQDVVFLSVTALVLVCFVALTWAQWPLLTADAARELYVPFQVKHGAVIYRDFYYLYGPVAPYAWAALLAVFGEHLQVLYIASAVHLGLLVGLLYGVARQLLSPAFSAAVVVLFLSHFALGRDLQGYLWPYAFAATFAVGWGLLLLLALLRHRMTRAPGWLVVAGVAVGLSCATKLEFGAAAWGLAGLYFLLVRYAASGSERTRFSWQEVVSFFVPAILIPGSILLLLLSQMSWVTIVESTWPTRLMALWNSGGVWKGTAATWRANLTWFAVVLAVLTFIAGYRHVWSWFRHRPFWSTAAIVLAAGAISWALTNSARLNFLLERGHQAWVGCSFLLLLAVLGFLLQRVWRQGEWTPAEFGWLLVAAYGLLVTARTVFHGLNEYSGYQAPVALIVWVGLAAVWLPERLAPIDSRRAVRVCLLVLLVGLSIRHLLDIHRTYSAPHVWVIGPYGAVSSPVVIGDPYRQALEFLRRELQPPQKFVAAPMEPSLYLFTGQDNPVKEDQLFFGYLTTPEEQFDFIQRLERAHVRFFVLSNYQESAMRFGIDYMPELGQWLRAQCRQVASFGEGDYCLRVYQTPFSFVRKVPLAP